MPWPSARSLRSAPIGFAVLLAGIAGGASTVGAADVPDWLRDAIARPIPEFAAHARAVVVELQSRVTLDPSGRSVERRRGAVRIATREGAEEAQATIWYSTPGGRIRQLDAWIVESDGNVSALPSSRVIDRTLLDNNLYDESRIRMIAATDEAKPGSLFAYEWICEQTQPFAQFEWEFQQELPVLRSRFELEVPDGWTVVGHVFNHAPVPPATEGGRDVWELRDLPEIADEPFRPDLHSLVPRLSVSATPPAGARNVGAVGFRDWGEVASWLDAISAGTGTSDDAVIRRARDLVAGAGSELDTLRRLGQFVQQVQYASIQVGLSRGGGYRPHAPGQVLARGYGDCKDKANLLRSLLAAVGRASYLVSLHAGDPEYVSREWPSPASFDHCILAIPLRASRGFPAEVRASRFGTLLIFDPTAPSTPLGSLPLADQGGWAMLSAAGEHEPFRLPVLAPESSWIERRVDLSLDADGGAAATLIERCAGDAAMRVRALLHGLNRLDYRTAIETVVHQAAPGSSVGRVWVRDDTLAGHFETEAEFQVPRYAQLMQSRLMVVKPLLLSHLGVALAEDHPRRYPVELSCEAVRETLIVHLPAGFTVDELPDSAAIETPFASFHSHSRIEGAALRLSLSLTVREAMVPANQFHSVRDFYARVRSAEETPAVLAKE